MDNNVFSGIFSYVLNEFDDDLSEIHSFGVRLGRLVMVRWLLFLN